MRFLICLFFPFFLVAHPHAFVDVKFNIHLSPVKLDRVDVTWVMDEMTSSWILMDFDTNQNAAIDPAEIPLIKSEAFDHLVELNYLMFMQVDGKPVTFTASTDFSASITDNRVVYSFSLPLSEGLSPNSKVRISSFDMDNFMAMTIKSEDVRLIKPDSMQLAPRITEEDMEYTYAYIVNLEL